MARKTPDLRFTMFGRLALFYKGEELKLDKSGATKVMQLLSMILYHREGVAKDVLLRNLYGDKDLADRNNNFRVTMFKLRKMLSQAGLPAGNYVTVQSDIYRWDPGIPCTCDVWEFWEHLEKARAAQAAGDRKKEKELRLTACGLYTAELLQALSFEDWVIMEALALKRAYSDSLKRLCTLLGEEKNFLEIIDLCNVAESIYPYDEWWLVKIDALMAINQYDEALSIYQAFTGRYFEELGLSPTEEMLQRYQKIRSATKRQYNTVDEIYHELAEPESSSPGGVCVNHQIFIDRFQFLQRISERSGESNFLVLLTMLRRSGKPLDLGEMGSEMENIMRDILQRCLRRSDTFTKYNSSQYLMLLVGINLESVRVVTKRIDQKLLQIMGNGRMICQYRALPMRQPETKEQDQPSWDFFEDTTGGNVYDGQGTAQAETVGADGAPSAAEQRG